jgi:hypothetical protein
MIPLPSTPELENVPGHPPAAAFLWTNVQKSGELTWGLAALDESSGLVTGERRFRR